MRLLQLLTILLGAPLAAQTTRDVPGTYATIQAAINASVDGDTVLVAPGSYLEHLDYLAKAIEVRSSGGAAVTTIRGGGTGPVIAIRGVIGACAVRGFTIEDGQGDDWLGSGMAGGVTAWECGQVTISECVIRNNVGSNSMIGTQGGPGGVYIALSQYLVDQCTIEGNRGADAIDASNTTGGTGGIRLTSGGGTIRSCVIADNDGGLGGATANSTAGGEGGLYLQYPSPGSVIDCTFENNRGGASGIGSSTNGGAGGLKTRGREVRIDRCRVVGNTGGTDGPGHGTAGAGGIAMKSGGGGIWPNTVLANCLVADNVGGDPGVLPQSGAGPGGAGGVDLGTGSYSVLNCTIVRNFGGVQGAGGLWAHTVGDVDEVSNCILWANDGWGAGKEQILYAGSDQDAFVVSHCDVQDGWTGDNNIDLDPAFVDFDSGDFRLSCTSPIIDLGSEAIADIGTEDLATNPRVAGQTIDIGAYEFVAETFPTYCIVANNSSGSGARISAEGCHSIAANDLTLTVTGLPGTPGVFFYGPTQIQVTFGDGFRCVGGAVHRMPPMSAMGQTFEKQLDLSILSILPGVQANFQYWFRDQAAGGAGYNLSDGVQIDFTP